MRRFLKGVLIFLTTIAMLTGIVVGIPLALLFKTTNQPFNKNTTDIELRFGDRLYEAVMNRRAIFEENPDKASPIINVRLTQNDAIEILNTVIKEQMNLTNFENEDYYFILPENENIIIKNIYAKFIDGQFAIEADVRVYGFRTILSIPIEISAVGTLVEISIGSPIKLGHIRLDNFKQNIIDIIGTDKFSIDLSEHLNEGGFFKYIIDNDAYEILFKEGEANLNIDLTEIIVNEEKNQDYHSYNIGDIKTNSFATYVEGSRTLRVSQTDFNGFIMKEYLRTDENDPLHGKPKIAFRTSQDILRHTYFLETTDVSVDARNNLIYYGLDIEGVRSYALINYEIDNDIVARRVTFEIIDININGQNISGLEERVMDEIYLEQSFTINYEDFEEAFTERFIIKSIEVDFENGDLVFEVDDNPFYIP
ncbi:MAG: hypothetical protein ACOX26_03685 [Bacilli bacterium]